MVSLAWLREAKKKSKRAVKWAQSEETRGKVKRFKAASKKVGARAEGISKRMEKVDSIDLGFGSDMFGFEMPSKPKESSKKRRKDMPKPKEGNIFDNF